MGLAIALLDSLLVFYAFLSGVFCASVYLEFPWPRVQVAQVISDLLQNGAYLYYWQTSTALFLVIALFSMLLRNMRMVTTGDICLTSSRGSLVQISNKALTDFIHKIVSQIEGVHSANVSVSSNRSRSKIDVKIYLTLWEGTSYPEVNDKIQDQVRRKIALDMGIEHIRSIPVVLKRMIPRESSAAHPSSSGSGGSATSGTSGHPSTSPSQHTQDMTYEEVSLSQ